MSTRISTQSSTAGERKRGSSSVSTTLDARYPATKSATAGVTSDQRPTEEHQIRRSDDQHPAQQHDRMGLMQRADGVCSIRIGRTGLLCAFTPARELHARSVVHTPCRSRVGGSGDRGPWREARACKVARQIPLQNARFLLSKDRQPSRNVTMWMSNRIATSVYRRAARHTGLRTRLWKLFTRPSPARMTRAQTPPAA